MRILQFFRLGWLFNKQVAWGLFWLILMILIALGVCMVGVRIAGDIEQWENWLIRYALVFLLWRMVLYAGLIYGWVWMRKRVIAREAGNGSDQTQIKRRLLVCEVCAIVVMLMMEVSNALV